MAGPSRRRPWPFDLVIGGTGLMLVKGKGAPLVATKVQPFEPAGVATNYSYDSQPPFAERPQPFADMSLGYGLKIQQGYNDRRYRFGTNVDLSIAGLWLKGPDITSYTPGTVDSTNGIQQLVEMGGVIYATNGRYIQKRVSDVSWTATDLGVGKAALPSGAAVFASGGTATTLLFVPMAGTDKAVSFDGTTATAMATHVSLAYCAVGSEFWRFHGTNQAMKCDRNADPTVEANYGASFRIGDRTSAINNAAVTPVGGSMVILKPDGIYSLTEDGLDHKLFGALSFGTSSEDGRYVGFFGNDIYVSFQKTTYRIVPTVTFGVVHLDLEEIGPEKLTENDSVVSGRGTAFAGDGAHGAYMGLYNSDTGNSFLMKFGSWLNANVVDGQLNESKRIDAWHGSLATFTGKKITAMLRSSVGAPSDHYRLYLGFSDASLGWFTLPCVANPVGCTQYAYTTTDGHVYLPLWHGTYEADAKTLRALSALGPNLSSSNYVQFQYKVDPSAAAYTAFGSNFATAPRTKLPFPNETTTYLADLDVVLHNAFNTSCPQVTAIVPHFAVRPALIREYKGIVNASDGAVKRDGRPMRLSGAAAKQVIYDAAAAAGSVTVILPTEESAQMSFGPDYGEAITWDERLNTWQAGVSWSAIELATNAAPIPSTLYGTVARLGPYTVGDLAGFSISDLGSI